VRCGSARPWVSHPWLGYIPPTAPTCLGLEQGGLGPRAMLPRHWSARGGGARAAPRRRHAVDLHGEEFTSLVLGDATAMATLSGKEREKPWERERGREGRSHERTSSHRIPRGGGGGRGRDDASKEQAAFPYAARAVTATCLFLSCPIWLVKSRAELLIQHF